MKVSIKYPVLNVVRILDPFPLRDGDDTFFLEEKNGFITFIGLTRAGLAPSDAPQIDRLAGRSGIHLNQPKFAINFPNTSFADDATRRLRSWRALLAPIVQIEINFTTPTLEFIEEEDEDIPVKSYSPETKQVVSVLDEYGIFGRAFLASKHENPTTETSAFFLDGISDLDSQRFVQAYNNFFLFLESMYGNGKFKEKDIVSAFRSSNEFMQAFAKACDFILAQKKPTLPFELSDLNDPEIVVTELVKRRGFLRHHSMKNQWRWKPSEQEKYRSDAGFVSHICQQALNKHSSPKIWGKEISEEFMNKAHEAGHKLKIGVEVTIWDNGLPRVIPFPSQVYPQKTMTSALALEVIKNAIAMHQEDYPEIEIATIRAFEQNSGVELLRYSLGTTIPQRPSEP